MAKRKMVSVPARLLPREYDLEQAVLREAIKWSKYAESELPLCIATNRLIQFREKSKEKK